MSNYKITIGPPRDNDIGGRVWPIRHNDFMWGTVTKNLNGGFYWVKVDGSVATGHGTLEEARSIAKQRLEKYLDEQD